MGAFAYKQERNVFGKRTIGFALLFVIFLYTIRHYITVPFDITYRNILSREDGTKAHDLGVETDGDYKVSNHVPPETTNVAKLESRKVTAVIISWKRLDNIRKIITHLCQYDMFLEIILWNNNPDVTLEHHDIVAKNDYVCSSLVKIYNSPKNLKFVARYLACSIGQGAYCYFQDDDWIVPYMRSFYANFLRYPYLIHTITNQWVYSLTNWKWKFSNKDISMHTAFSWVGTGAFASKETVQTFLNLAGWVDLDKKEFQYADMYFTTFMNHVPFQIECELIELPQDHAFSGQVNGIARNKYHMHKGLKYLYHYLTHPTSPFERRQLGPDPGHRYSRAACSTDRCIFMTNKNEFSEQESMFKYQPHVDIDRAEKQRASYRNTQDYHKHPYHSAVDGNAFTSWKSTVAIRKGDFIGLDLLEIVSGHVNIILITEHDLAYFQRSSLAVEGSVDDDHYVALKYESRCRTKLNPTWWQEYDREDYKDDPFEQMDDASIFLTQSLVRRPLPTMTRCEINIIANQDTKSLNFKSLTSFRFIRFTSMISHPFPFSVFEISVS